MGKSSKKHWNISYNGFPGQSVMAMKTQLAKSFVLRGPAGQHFIQAQGCHGAVFPYEVCHYQWKFPQAHVPLPTKDWGRMYFPSSQSSVPLLFNDQLPKRPLGTLGLHLISHPAPNCLAGWPLLLQPPHPLHWTHATHVTLLDIENICPCLPLSYFWIPLSSWLSLTAPSSDFPWHSLPFTNFSFLCPPLKCSLTFRFFLWLLSLLPSHSLYIQSQ